METPRRNREVSRKHAPGRERAPPRIDAIHDASTPVKTTILARRGIEKVRILSESRLHSLLGSGGDGAPPAPGREGPPCAGGAANAEAHGESEARALSALREATIGAIEKRMERLSVAFRTIAGALERLEGACPAGRAQPCPEGGLALVQRELLREMLF